jgi:hypothetical protein
MMPSFEIFLLMVALKEKKGKENKERLTHIMC